MILVNILYSIVYFTYLILIYSTSVLGAKVVQWGPYPSTTYLLHINTRSIKPSLVVELVVLIRSQSKHRSQRDPEHRSDGVFVGLGVLHDI